VKEKYRVLHHTALAALFSVGNTLLCYPWKNSESGVLFSFLLSMGVSLAATLLLYPVMRYLYRGKLSKKGKHFAETLVAAVLGGYAFLCTYRACDDYLSYAMEMILPSGSRLLLAAIFLLAVALLASLDAKALDSFSLLCFLLIASSVFILFAFGIPHFRWEYVRLEIPKESDVLKRSLAVFSRDVLFPSALLSAYFALAIPQKRKGSLTVGMLLGYGLLLLCVLQTLLCFGSDYTASLPYPYSFSVKILSVGPYFFRPEGISYPTDLLACLLRGGVCLSVARRLLGRFCSRLSRYLPTVCAFLLFGILILR
jgi:hypothetical protein